MAFEQSIISRLPRSKIEFRYSVGDLCLFRTRFKAAVLQQPFDPAANPVSLPLEAPEIPDDVSLVVHAGQHIAVRLAKVQPTRNAICYVRNQTVNHYIDLR